VGSRSYQDPDLRPNEGSVDHQISKAPQRSAAPMLPQVLGTRWYPGIDSKAEEERKIHNLLNSVAGKYDFTAVGGTSVSREAFRRRARTTRMAPLDETLSFLAQNGSKIANHGRPSCHL